MKYLIGIYLILFSCFTLSNENVVGCGDWKYKTTFEWAECNWTIDGGYEDQLEESLKEKLIASAKEEIKQAAIDYISAELPVIGGLIGVFSKSSSENSQLQMAVERILKAITASEERLASKMLDYYEARDIADLESLKLAINEYQRLPLSARSSDVGIAELDRLWYETVSLGNYLATYSDLRQHKIGDAILAYHNYLSVVTLQLVLSAQRTTYKLQNTEDAHLIEETVLANYQEEIGRVFEVVESFQWRESAESYMKDKVDKDWKVCGSMFEFCRYIAFNYLGETHKFTLTQISGEKVWDPIHMYYSVEGKYAVDLFGTTGGYIGYYFYEGDPLDLSQYTPEYFLEEFTQEVERQMIIDGYSSTQEILDTWQKMIYPGTPRVLNYADQKLLEYFPDFSKLDTDNDGFDDQFEMDHPDIGLDPNVWNYGEEDYDGDGASNMEEYLAGTDIKDENDNPERRKLLAAMIPIINLVLQ